MYKVKGNGNAIVQEQVTQVCTWVFVYEYLQLITYKHYSHIFIYLCMY